MDTKISPRIKGILRQNTMINAETYNLGQLLEADKEEGSDSLLWL